MENFAFDGNDGDLGGKEQLNEDLSVEKFGEEKRENESGCDMGSFQSPQTAEEEKAAVEEEQPEDHEAVPEPKDGLTCGSDGNTLNHTSDDSSAQSLDNATSAIHSTDPLLTEKTTDVPVDLISENTIPSEALAKSTMGQPTNVSQTGFQPPPAKRRSKWDRSSKTEFDSLTTGSSDDMLGAEACGDDACQVFVSNLPLGTDEVTTLQFFKGALFAISGKEVVVSSTKRNVEHLLPGTVHVLKLSSKDSILIALRLDGIKIGNNEVRVTRTLPLSSDSSCALSMLNRNKNSGEPVCRQLIINDLPLHYNDVQVRDILEQFGNLSRFDLSREPSTGLSRGTAYFEYEDSAVADVALMALNGSHCAGQTVRVQRALLPSNVAATAAAVASTLGAVGAPVVSPCTTRGISMSKQIFSNPVAAAQVKSARRLGEVPSEVVQLLNVVFQEDLLDDAEVATIKETILQEASKYGVLKEVLIPRPTADFSFVPGVGKVFLRYGDVTSARKSQLELNGRLYEGRRVVCAAFYPLDKFMAGKYSLS